MFLTENCSDAMSIQNFAKQLSVTIDDLCKSKKDCITQVVLKSLMPLSVSERPFHCTNLNKNAQICFLDDQYHPHMLHPNVYYLHLNEYHYFYEPTFIFQKFKEEFQLSDSYISYLQNSDQSLYLDFQENKNHMQLSKEKLISKKILQELNYFIQYFGKPLTRKAKYKQPYTRKKYTQRHPYKHIH